MCRIVGAPPLCTPARVIPGRTLLEGEGRVGDRASPQLQNTPFFRLQWPVGVPVPVPPETQSAQRFTGFPITVTDRDHLSLDGRGRPCPRQESSQHQQQGQPAQCHRWSLHACHFYALSASICSCPHRQGNLWCASESRCNHSGCLTRSAIEKTGKSCPLGWFSSGSYCVKSRKQSLLAVLRQKLFAGGSADEQI